MPKRQLEAILAPGDKQRPGSQWLRRGDAVEPAAIQRGRYRQVIAKGDVEDLAALEAEVAAAE
ncbi:hypothetical protein [Bradyrhizobium elkanii]|uniref:hypothetical protein n=1 Tax=Bradyrhizobium elkanii TaxID=29448 RepID=UPI0034E59244